jgi:hypothetical protein
MQMSSQHQEAIVPLITVKAGTPIVPPGTYRADLVGIAPKRMVTAFSKNGEEQDFLEWTWLVHGENKQAEITSLTSVATGPKSRIFEYLVALLGADKVKIDAGFDEADLVGKTVMVQIVATEDGFSKVDKIMGAPKGQTKAAPAAAAAEAPAAPTQEALPDDLPF